MRNILLIVLIIVALPLLIGCTKSSKPSDLPPLYPCTLTFTQDGVPLAEATVRLISTTEMKYHPASETGSDGKIAMTTYGFPGVPADKYKVTVIKEILDNVVYRDNPSTGRKEMASFKRYRTVEPVYSSADSSPLELEITGREKKIEQTFDVGKAVRIERKGQ
jgi:hypothetical protein